MDKKALQTYSVWAKENLEQQVEVALKTLGINSDDDIKDAKLIGDFTVIEGDENSYPADYYEKRNKIVSMVKNDSYKNVIEEVAYTWFNRFVALRFMELHDFLPHGFRVLSDKNGGIEPEIIKNMSLAKFDLNLDMDYCNQLRSAGNTEELYRYILLQQCNALADILPMLFEKTDDAISLLLPKVLLRGDTVVTKLIAIPEDNFMKDVEIIGWMYQFYISKKKDDVNASKKTITKDTLPAVTQLFTPEWIVRYMVENSVGRIWLESYPNSSLKSSMHYYVDEVEQTDEVKQKLEEIRYKNVNPEDIKIIEPCCGSGHILVYLFDLLYEMYDEKGYQKSDIPTLILKNNLHGLEIDKRAAQLASFALVMKARSVNSRFFNSRYYVRPMVYEILDSKILLGLDYKNHLQETGILTSDELRQITKLAEDFRYAKTIGSLLKLQPYNFELLSSAIEKMRAYEATNIFNYRLFDEGVKLLDELFVQAKVFTTKFDVLITNPPYIGISKMEDHVKKYAVMHYPDSKTDMYAMFMETDFVKANGFTSMINMHSWMFLSSFENFRKKIILNDIINMVHLGSRAFEEISGEVVQTTSFVFRNQHISGYKGTYYKLLDGKSQNSKEQMFLNNENCYNVKQDRFSKIPGFPFAYWVSNQFVSSFENEKIYDYSLSPSQNITGNNERFLRYHWELCNSLIDDKDGWIFYAKGGEFRRWWGNLELVINWTPNARKIYQFGDGKHASQIINKEFWYKKAITWGLTAANRPSFRVMRENATFDKGGSSIIVNEDYYNYVLGLLNTKLYNEYASVLNPTISIQVKDVRAMPLIVARNELVESIVKGNIDISRIDYNNFETSWDFKAHPLVELSRSLWDATAVGASMQAYYGDEAPLAKSPLERCYLLWQGECQKRFDDLKANEEELNRIFIDIYGLQDELTPEVEDKDVTVRKADLTRDIKSLISYLIGVEMGRYSLDVTGLAYAGGEWDSSKYVTYQPDEDGIVPVYSKLGMEDNLTQRVIDLIKLIYGEDSYKANIDFIAEALGKKNNESSEETLNRYICDDFFNDHVKIYQKRPIYWMFSSGKYSGFKCLIYMHRYNENTLARINSKYFLAESTRLKKELEEISKKVEVAEGRERIALEKERTRIAGAYSEAYEYGQILDHMANKFINIDLDDGVKVNYEKFQKVELVTDGGTKIKKDLLAPIK